MRVLEYVLGPDSGENFILGFDCQRPVWNTKRLELWMKDAQELNRLIMILM